jgi:hypothetical protein
MSPSSFNDCGVLTVGASIHSDTLTRHFKKAHGRDFESISSGSTPPGLRPVNALIDNPDQVGERLPRGRRDDASLYGEPGCDGEGNTKEPIDTVSSAEDASWGVLDLEGTLSADPLLILQEPNFCVTDSPFTCANSNLFDSMLDPSFMAGLELLSPSQFIQNSLFRLFDPACVITEPESLSLHVKAVDPMHRTVDPLTTTSDRGPACFGSGAEPDQAGRAVIRELVDLLHDVRQTVPAQPTGKFIVRQSLPR